MIASIFSANYRNQPYWWDRTPRPQLPAITLPRQADIAIVGSGYSGLCAALQTARAGRHTVIFDAADAGWGCSSRNGGQISTSIKPDFAALSHQYGAEHAQRIIRTGHDALTWIGDFIASENIACDFTRCGRFYAAHSPRQFKQLVKKFNRQPKGLETEAEILPRNEQRREIGSDFYHGGVIQANHASLDPARYHQGLLNRVHTAGASLFGHCAVTAIVREGQHFRLQTAHGSICARHVIIATNGYTGALTPWLQRRVIPISSTLIATEAISPELMAELIPNNRNVVDTRRVVFYYRISPDRQRILFGGRVSIKDTDPAISAVALHKEMVKIFPQLQDIKISHSWMGFIAYSFDALPHIGQHDGLYYSMGYCGSGVSMASYLGTRLGQQVLGLAEGNTALNGLNFQTRPFYQGKPWFLAPSIRYYRCLDRLGV